MTNHHLGLDLSAGFQHNADNNQQGCAAQRDAEAERAAQQHRQHGDQADKHGAGDRDLV